MTRYESLFPSMGAIFILSFISVLTFILFLYFVGLGIPHNEARLAEDDYFYYATIAHRFVTDGKMSFGGLVETNGFHPLWMAVIIGLTCLFPSQSSAFFVTLMVVVAALAALGAFSFGCMARRWMPQSKAVTLTAVLYFAFAWRIGITGMETVLTLALLPIFILLLDNAYRKEGGWRFFWVGFCAGAIVLSRLDSFIMVGALSAGLAWIHRRLPSWAGMGGLFVGGILIVAPYIAYNVVHFGAVMPLSGLAKSLKLPGAPLLSMTSLRSNFVPGAWLAVIIPCSLWASVLGWGIFLKLCIRRGLGQFGWVTFAAVIGAVTFVLTTALRSDWGLWSWYHYNLIFAALCCAQAVLGTLWRPSPRTATLAAMLIIAVTSAYMVSLTIYRNYQNSVFLRPAQKLADAVVDKPGIYAIGDVAGAVGYLIAHPLVQLEGLVEDRAMIESIRAQSDLIDVLIARKVTYYIASLTGDTHDGCWSAREPGNAGPWAPAMTAEFCATPVHRPNPPFEYGLIFSVADMAAGRRNASHQP